MELTHAYCDITKSERNAEGDLVVTGRATGPDLDLDRQICDAEWLVKAVPEWYRTGANVREMHTSIAAGRGDELVQDGDGWNLRSIVVDPVSARKVEKQVLRGYSIGIRNPQVIKDAKAPGGRIVGGQIVEISLVDRPANPSCTLMLAKSLKPGPQTALTIDAERRLIKVEELHDGAGELLDRLDKALQGYDLVAVQKGNNKAQIKDARKAIALLAGVVQAEAACLADGSATASCDIDMLMGAIHAIEYFVCREKEAAMAHVELSDTPDTTKAATPEAPAAPVVETVTPEAPPVEKAAEPTPETPDLTELVKAAVAEAIAPLQERLAKAEAAPQAGGPVLTRTAQDLHKAGAREARLAKAAEFERLAYEVNDSTRAGYLQLAAEERAAATS